VLARTAELRESEARYRRLTELASDWHWEQDEHGQFTTLHGHVTEMLGGRLDALTGPPGPGADAGWNEDGRDQLRAAIASREPFLDFPISRLEADGGQRHFRVSGEPMFTQACRFVGYRGVGVEVTSSP